MFDPSDDRRRIGYDLGPLRSRETRRSPQLVDHSGNPVSGYLLGAASTSPVDAGQKLGDVEPALHSQAQQLRQESGTAFKRLVIRIVAAIQSEHEMKLEQMRHTVDQKFKGRIESRFGQSFKQVSDRLVQVHKRRDANSCRRGRRPETRPHQCENQRNPGRGPVRCSPRTDARARPTWAECRERYLKSILFFGDSESHTRGMRQRRTETWAKWPGRASSLAFKVPQQSGGAP